jgi:hypothetical protein
MRHAYTSRAAAAAGGLAAGHRYWFGRPFPAGDTPFSYANLPSGKLMASAGALGPYLIAHLNQGQYAGGQVLSPEGVRLLHTPIAGNYAMGWAAQGGLLLHDGSVPDFGSTFLLDPQRKFGVALLWNVNTGGGIIPAYGLAIGVWRLLIGQPVAPPGADPRYGNSLALLSGLLMVELAWLAVSLVWLRAWRVKAASRRRRLWVCGLAALGQVALAIALIALLAQQQLPLPVMLLFVPDVTTLAVVLITLAGLWAALFPVLVFSRRRPASTAMEAQGVPA